MQYALAFAAVGLIGCNQCSRPSDPAMTDDTALHETASDRSPAYSIVETKDPALLKGDLVSATHHYLLSMSNTDGREFQMRVFFELLKFEWGAGVGGADAISTRSAAWALVDVQSITGKTAGFNVATSAFEVTYRLRAGRPTFVVDFDVFVGDFSRCRDSAEGTLRPIAAYQELVKRGFNGRSSFTLSATDELQPSCATPLAGKFEALHKRVEFTNLESSLVAEAARIELRGDRLAELFGSQVTLWESSAFDQVLPLGSPEDITVPGERGTTGR